MKSNEGPPQTTDQFRGPGQPGSSAPTFGPLALRSEAFRHLFKSSGNAMMIADDSRHFLAVNDAACALFGLAAEQILGRRIDDFTASEWRPVLPVLWAQFMEAGTQAGEYELLVGRRRIQFQFAATANIAPGRHLGIVLSPTGRELAATASDPAPGPRSQLLTSREREVLTRLAHGRRAEEAAEELGIARNTVQNHLRSARAKLGAKTRGHAIALALAQGEILLERGDPVRSL